MFRLTLASGFGSVYLTQPYHTRVKASHITDIVAGRIQQHFGLIHRSTNIHTYVPLLKQLRMLLTRIIVQLQQPGKS